MSEKGGHRWMIAAVGSRNWWCTFFFFYKVLRWIPDIQAHRFFCVCFFLSILPNKKEHCFSQQSFYTSRAPTQEIRSCYYPSTALLRWSWSLYPGCLFHQTHFYVQRELQMFCLLLLKVHLNRRSSMNSIFCSQIKQKTVNS